MINNQKSVFHLCCKLWLQKNQNTTFNPMNHKRISKKRTPSIVPPPSFSFKLFSFSKEKQKSILPPLTKQLFSLFYEEVANLHALFFPTSYIQ